MWKPRRSWLAHRPRRSSLREKGCTGKDAMPPSPPAYHTGIDPPTCLCQALQGNNPFGALFERTAQVVHQLTDCVRVQLSVAECNLVREFEATSRQAVTRIGNEKPALGLPLHG